MKYRLFIVLVCLCMFCTFGIGSRVSNAMEDKGSILTYNNVTKVDVSAGGPMLIDHQKYSYATSSKNEIAYILNYINNFNLEDDGKFLIVNDGSSYSIKIYMVDGSAKRCRLGSGVRFYTDSDKQYGMDIKEYQRFLDFVNGLKTDKIVLEKEVDFQPSEWAKEDVVKAVKNGLAPKWNQINYTGNINRLEVCQLIDNLITVVNGTQSINADNYPFEDTTDVAVKNLYSLNIINGKTNTEFAPWDNITREEFAKMLLNAYTYLHNNNIKNGDLTYLDKDSISAYAVQDVNKVTRLGLMRGNENNEFEPRKTITKEEVIVTLLRLSELK